MPFRNRFRSAPVKSDKHEITWSNLAQDASSIQTVTLVDVVQPTAKNTSTEIGIGSHVYSIYFEFHFSANVVTNPKVIHWQISAYPDGATTGAPSLYYQTDRARIFKRGMEMLPKDTGTVFKRIFVARVPKKSQRLPEDGNISFQYISTSAEAINACGIAIYKEIS